MSKLNELEISYVINYTDKKPFIKNFHKNNKYAYYLNEAKSKIDFKVKVDAIINKIKSADINQIKDILELLDEYFRN